MKGFLVCVILGCVAAPAVAQVQRCDEIFSDYDNARKTDTGKLIDELNRWLNIALSAARRRDDDVAAIAETKVRSLKTDYRVALYKELELLDLIEKTCGDSQRLSTFRQAARNDLDSHFLSGR